MFTIIVSHERSGSHLLAELLKNFGGLRVFDEVCNADAVAPNAGSASFHWFRLDWAKKYPDLAMRPSFGNVRDFGRAYFDYLAEKAPAKNCAVDIKYGHLHNFDPAWHPVFRRPMLFTLCETMPMKVIHLYRENVVEATVSAHIAEATKVWHSWQADAKPELPTTHRLNIWQVVRDSVLLREQTKWISENWLQDTDNFKITYDTLSRVANEGGPEIAQLAKFVGGKEVKPFAPKLKKLGQKLQDSVSNYAELVAACESAGLGQFLKD
jgi:LPS sulfotransferase NodH